MFQKTVLGNGVRILSEQLPARTVSLGVWVDVGSRDEGESNNGCSHFVEHMLYKGTPARNAQQIARELDVLGGMSNGFTSRESTCYYATVLDDKLAKLVELLADIFLNSNFAQEEVERERQVILQEISMVEDMPDEQIHDLFSTMFWGEKSVGNTVLGHREVVAAMDAAKLHAHLARFYTADRVMITAAGNVRHDELVDLLTGPFSRLAPAGMQPDRFPPEPLPPARRIFSKSLEQVHVVLGANGCSARSEDRYRHLLMNIILGGNMSSRLFQEIREKRGLAYSIYSYLSSFLDCGYAGIYMAVEPETVNQTVELIAHEIDTLCRLPVGAFELADAKDFAKAGLFLAADNMEARMMRLARDEFYFKRYVPMAEVAEAIDGITIDDVTAMAKQVFQQRPLSATALGPLTEGDINWLALDCIDLR